MQNILINFTRIKAGNIFYFAILFKPENNLSRRNASPLRTSFDIRSKGATYYNRLLFFALELYSCSLIISTCCKISTESSRWYERYSERCHRYQRHNLLRDLIQLYSLPINFLRNLAPPQWGAGIILLHPAWSVPHFSCVSFSSAHVLPSAKRAGQTRNLRRSRDSPPASALYVHDRVSGCVRDWSNHPGLEICCGCIPPSDNVAMDQPSPHPPPQPRTGPIGSGTRMERPTGKNERSRTTIFSIQTQQVPAQ